VKSRGTINYVPGFDFSGHHTPELTMSGILLEIRDERDMIQNRELYASISGY
jgi:hypothetical protein